MRENRKQRFKNNDNNGNYNGCWGAVLWLWWRGRLRSEVAPAVVAAIVAVASAVEKRTWSKPQYASTVALSTGERPNRQGRPVRTSASHGCPFIIGLAADSTSICCPPLFRTSMPSRRPRARSAAAPVENSTKASQYRVLGWRERRGLTMRTRCRFHREGRTPGCGAVAPSRLLLPLLLQLGSSSRDASSPKRSSYISSWLRPTGIPLITRVRARRSSSEAASAALLLRCCCCRRRCIIVHY